MEIGLRVPLEGEVVREGAVVLPARLLVDVVRALPGDRGDARAARRPSRTSRSSAGNATFHIRTLRLEDFPPLPGAGAATRRVEVPAAAFVETVLKVAALGVARRDAPGAHRHPRLGGGRRAADGRDRLLPARASRRRKLESPLEGAFEANVPARALQELARIVQHGGAEALAVSVRDEPGRVRGRRASCCPRG